MNMNDIFLSLVIPTNGVPEWVFPVLDSIYAQEFDQEQFEVIVTDNGTNREFEQGMQTYVSRHSNLVYKKTQAKQFLNQVEAFKLARGRLIKFVNHRMKLCPGAIRQLAEFARDNAQSRPGVYFMNGAIPGKTGRETFGDFDGYVRGLGHFSSWSAGTAMWKEDFDRMDHDQTFNATFPHTDFVFFDKKKTEYIIDHSVMFEEIPVDDTKKGHYDLFYAFAVEYPGLILELCRKGDISLETFLAVKEDNLDFLATLYYGYVLRKMPCSYDVSGYKEAIRVFYCHRDIWHMIAKIAWKKVLGKR